MLPQKLEDAWTRDGGQVLEEMDEWLEAVIRTKTEPTSKADSSSVTEVKVSPVTSKWFDCLVPRIWDVVTAPGSGE